MKHMKGVEPTATEAQPKKRRILFDHPIITEVVFVVLDLFLASAIIAAVKIAGVSLEGKTELLATAGASIVAALLTTLFFHLYFRNEFDGIFEWSSFGLMLTLPAYAFVFTNVFDFTAMRFVFTVPGTTINSLPFCLALALSPGIFEELLFRGIPASNWMRTAKDSGAIMKCAWATAIIFGLTHGFNAISGAAISATVYQIFYSACIGIFFCAVFLRTASIWPNIIIHTLVDFTAFLFMDMDKGVVLTQELELGPAFYVTLVLAIMLLLLGLFMLRKSKHEQIMQLWNRKWHKTGIVEQDRFLY